MLLLLLDHLPKLCCVRGCAVGFRFPAIINLQLVLVRFQEFKCQNLEAKSESSDSVAIDLQKLKDVLQNASKTGILAQRARVDQAVGLYYRKENLTF